MELDHRGKRRRIDAPAYVAPTAVICGDVTIGADTQILFGAVVVAEGGPVEIGAQCIIMEYDVICGTARYPTRLGNHVLVGPHAHLSGCTVADNVFLATGASVFNDASTGSRATVRINGTGAHQDGSAGRGGSADLGGWR
jgi:carbonic anhydrase/acetyltransferase-like protein (isoleucine patch superfamily)